MNPKTMTEIKMAEDTMLEMERVTRSLSRIADALESLAKCVKSHSVRDQNNNIQDNHRFNISQTT